MEIDALAIGMGVILMKGSHAIAYINKTLSKHRQGLSAYEKEFLTVLFVVKKWHYYLIDCHFIIWTDQQSLKFLIEERVSTPL